MLYFSLRIAKIFFTLAYIDFLKYFQPSSKKLRQYFECSKFTHENKKKKVSVL